MLPSGGRQDSVIFNELYRGIPVSDLSIVHHPQRTAMSTLALRKREDPPPLVMTAAKGRRCRIWDIAPALHCSIIGTCLSAAELRQFFV